MNSPQDHFETIANELSSSQSGVSLGKMMSSPGLKFQDKVFAFYHNNEMGFRLGPNFDPEKHGLKYAKPLSPFKTKPPLKGWFIIETPEQQSWNELANMALEYTKTL